MIHALLEVDVTRARRYLREYKAKTGEALSFTPFILTGLAKAVGEHKRGGGTVALSAVGMFGKGAGWGIPIAGHTLMLTLGGIAEKPGVVDGQMAIRQFLSLTISFDHDIIDGAPAARFTQRLKDLIESGFGLLDQEATSPLSESKRERLAQVTPQ